MANVNPLKRDAAKKSSPKKPVTVMPNGFPVSAHGEELITGAGTKQPSGVIRAVMAAPPPTGQPFMPPGKSPRVADRPKVANKPAKKRPAMGATA